MKARDIRFSYGDREALKGVSIEVASGEQYGLLGPNGSGKTTLFRIVSTLLRPTSGELSLFGVDVLKHPHAARLQLGVVFQNPSLDGKLSVRENMWHQGHLYGMRGGTLRKRCDELLDRFGIRERAGDRAEVLSGGLRRRVEIAKGLLHRPRLLLLDEPSTGLDVHARRELSTTLEDLKRQDGVTIIQTTHLMEEAEECDRIAILDHGRVVAEGDPATLKTEVGGQVLTLRADQPDALIRDLQADFELSADLVDGTVRLEQPDAHELIPRLCEKYGERIFALELAQPSLEDVFVHRTGHHFHSAAAAEESS